jgi:hypothetical protein
MMANSSVHDPDPFYLPGYYSETGTVILRDSHELHRLAARGKSEALRRAKKLFSESNGKAWQASRKETLGFW